MSYDLYLLPREPSVCGEREITAFFSGRKYYASNASASEALYKNAATGVYFTFNWKEGETAEGAEDALRRPHLCLNLNYFRPSFFGLEAALELGALMQAFSFEIFDPQREGMGNGPYSREAFLRGWNAGNQFAVTAIGKHQNSSSARVPRSDLEALWQWNYRLPNVQEEIYDKLINVIAQPMEVFMVEGSSRPAIHWNNAVPILIPEIAEGAVLSRTNWPRGPGGSPVEGTKAYNEFGYVEIDDILSRIDTHKFDICGRTYLGIKDDRQTGTDQVEQIFSFAENNAKPAVKHKLEDVLDAELFSMTD